MQEQIPLFSSPLQANATHSHSLQTLSFSLRCIPGCPVILLSDSPNPLFNLEMTKAPTGPFMGEIIYRQSGESQAGWSPVEPATPELPAFP